MGRWITKNGARIPIGFEDDLHDALSARYNERLPTLYLPKKEYGQVMHEINTWYKKEYDEKTIISKAIGNHVYTFVNHGYNEYRFIGKDSIETSHYDTAKEVVKNASK